MSELARVKWLGYIYVCITSSSLSQDKTMFVVGFFFLVFLMPK